ncbi:tripartite tricarboxylate transporter TctB family protein [Ensifer sp. YR511]|uniref:tripartite tricarboxylate transporter TctB family protein n=1 Tax=Ensifer sp. YR511 TaxID=1855294 RepID=UPI0008865FC4|nr:tripartite tricarboxylate transporter TctB family protein [Ensifer sp. YR511]SDN41165.1 Tripartite tricarboxylate transporter TctB family protein [Ensifer sp. YR511]
MSTSLLRIAKNKDVICAVVFGILGTGFVVDSLSLSFGEPMDMGPAFFPRMVGCALVLLALAIGIKGVANVLAEKGEDLKIALLPVLYVFVAIGLFVLTLRSLGLIVASLLLVGVTGVASRDRRWREVILMAAVLSIVAGLLFVYGLGLQAPLLPWR